MNVYRRITSTIEKLRLLFQRRVKDGQIAYLGNGAGVVEVPGKIGYVYARFPGGKDANGFARFGTPFMCRSGNAAYPNYEGATVYVAWGYGNEPEIVSAHYQELDQAGIDTRILNPLAQQSKWVYPWQLTYALPSAVANNFTSSFLVTVKKFLHFVGNVFQFYETNDSDEMIDLESYVPASDMHCYAALWLDTYTNEIEVTVSTAQSLFTPLDLTDLQELVTDRPPDATPLKAFYLANDQTTLKQSVNEVDLRQWLNFPEPFGLPNPIVYRERIRTGFQQLYAGILVTTGTLIIDGLLIGVDTAAQAGGGSGGGAPDDATYIVQVADGDLPNAQDLDSLTDNSLLKVLTGGVLDEAVADTDYSTPAGVAALIAAQRVWKTVRVATDDVLSPSSTYSNGSSGVGATLTGSSNGAIGNQDGITLAAGDRILVKNEASSLKNGVYVVTTLGSGGTPYVLTRTTDADTADEIRDAAVMPREGTTQSRRMYFLFTTGTITMGTTGLDWGQIFANVALSNLGSTSINQNLIPATPGTFDLGSDTDYWNDTYFNGAFFPDAGGGAAPSGFIHLYGDTAGSEGVLFTEDDNGNQIQITPQTALVTHSVTSGTSAGGTTATTWVTRSLNTEVDNYGLLTLSSNRVTLVAGVYRIWMYATVVAASAATTVAVHRLYNHTQSLEIAKSPPVRLTADTGAPVAWETEWTANGTDEIRVDTYASAARATLGLGQAASTGSNEIFTIMAFRKIG